MQYFKRTYGAPYNFTAHYEFEGRWAKRQMDTFGGTVLLLEGFECCESPIEEMSFDPCESICAVQFDQWWSTYSQQPHGTQRTDSSFLKKWLFGFQNPEDS